MQYITKYVLIPPGQVPNIDNALGLLAGHLLFDSIEDAEAAKTLLGGDNTHLAQVCKLDAAFAFSYKPDVN